MSQQSFLVGTLSFQLDNWEMTLSAKERRKIIRDIALECRPDLLLCAGFSVDTEADIEWLSKQNFSTACYAEAETAKGNWNYFVVGGGYKKFRRLKRQLFATREQANAAEIRKLERAKSRQHIVCGTSTYLLVCGELNIVKGRDDPELLSPSIARRIWASQIVLNPTHDRMSDRGTLTAKRRFLSRKVSGRDRIYVSASNWHTNKPEYGAGNQRKCADTLHTVYRGRRRLDHNRPFIDDRFEYREVTLSNFLTTE